MADLSYYPTCDSCWEVEKYLHKCKGCSKKVCEECLACSCANCGEYQCVDCQWLADGPGEEQEWNDCEDCGIRFCYDCSDWYERFQKVQCVKCYCKACQKEVDQKKKIERISAHVDRICQFVDDLCARA